MRPEPSLLLLLKGKKDARESNLNGTDWVDPPSFSFPVHFSHFRAHLQSAEQIIMVEGERDIPIPLLRKKELIT